MQRTFTLIGLYREVVCGTRLEPEIPDNDNTCHHRDFDVRVDVMEDGAEQHLYAECAVCGTKKSALVDWTRDWSTICSVSDEEFQQTVDAYSSRHQQ